ATPDSARGEGRGSQSTRGEGPLTLGDRRFLGRGNSPMESHDTSTMFVGREDELRLLGKELAEAAAGRGRLVTVAGDAGIGKTRIIEECIARASVPPGRVVWAPCQEQAGAPAYWPWVRAIRSYVSGCDPKTLAAELGPNAPEVAQLVVTLRERMPDIALP